MAVKVMLAPVVARAEEQARDLRPAEAAKPRRRRSSVYDAEGNEVFITLMCLKCHKMRPLSQFGLRRMADGAIRNQPWCRTCRSGGADGARRRKAEPEAAPPGPPAAAAPAKPVSAAQVAAEVAAAIVWRK